jgi:hypothetical protein
MSNEKHYDLLNELRELPKPVMQKQVQDQMLVEIHSFSANHEKRKRWENKMKMVYAGVVTSVAAAVMAITFITYNNAVVEDSINSEKPGAPTEQIDQNTKAPIQNQPLEPIDVALPEHQIGIEDVYFGIPFKKGEVFIDRRIEGDYTLVDIRDKNTNELLYRYGESLGDSNEKIVFREVYAKNFNTSIRLNIFVEIDKAAGTITKINSTNINYPPEPFIIESEMITSGSRTDKFPAEKVEVLGSIQLAKKNETEDPEKMFERETIYEGFEIGVIKK